MIGIIFKLKETGSFYSDRLTIVMFCAIWYLPYNLKNVKNDHGGVLLLVTLLAEAHSFTKCSTSP